MNLEKEIIHTLGRAFQELFGHQVEEADLSLQPTRKEFEGTYTFVVFPFLKIGNGKMSWTVLSYN